MYCSQCGSENKSGQRFCLNCGAPLPAAPIASAGDYGSYGDPPSSGFPGPASDPAYGSPDRAGFGPDRRGSGAPGSGYGSSAGFPAGSSAGIPAGSGLPAGEAVVRSLAASPVFLTAAITYSLSILVGLLVSATGLSGTIGQISGLLEQMGMSSSELAELQQYANEMSSGLQAYGFVSALVLSIPAILTAVALWLIFAAGRRSEEELFPTTGITILQVLNILGFIFFILCFLAGLLLLAGLVMAGSSYPSSYGSSGDDGSILRYGLLIIAAYIVIMIFPFLYYWKLIRMIGAAKEMAQSGRLVKRASIYVGVLTFLGIFGILPRLFAGGAPGALQVLLDIVSAVCFGILIFSFRSRTTEAERRPAAAYAGMRGHAGAGYAGGSPASAAPYGSAPDYGNPAYDRGGSRDADAPYGSAPAYGGPAYDRGGSSGAADPYRTGSDYGSPSYNRAPASGSAASPSAASPAPSDDPYMPEINASSYGTPASNAESASSASSFRDGDPDAGPASSASSFRDGDPDAGPAFPASGSREALLNAEPSSRAESHLKMSGFPVSDGAGPDRNEPDLPPDPRTGPSSRLKGSLLRTINEPGNADPGRDPVTGRSYRLKGSLLTPSPAEEVSDQPAAASAFSSEAPDASPASSAETGPAFYPLTGEASAPDSAHETDAEEPSAQKEDTQEEDACLRAEKEGAEQEEDVYLRAEEENAEQEDAARQRMEEERAAEEAEAVSPSFTDAPTSYNPPTVYASPYETTMTDDRTLRQLPAHLIRQKDGSDLLIQVPLLRIGRSSSMSDYVVTGNPAIGRHHADIVCHGTTYCIIDNHSVNHVFVDGQIIPPDQEYKLPDQAEIRLADEVFLFRVDRTFLP